MPRLSSLWRLKARSIVRCRAVSLGMGSRRIEGRSSEGLALDAGYGGESESGGAEAKISTAESKRVAYAIRTDEELLIARDTVPLCVGRETCVVREPCGKQGERRDGRSEPRLIGVICCRSCFTRGFYDNEH